MKNGCRAAKSCNKRGLLNMQNKEGSLQQPERFAEEGCDYACHVAHCQRPVVNSGDNEEQTHKYTLQSFLSRDPHAVLPAELDFPVKRLVEFNRRLWSKRELAGV